MSKRNKNVFSILYIALVVLIFTLYDPGETSEKFRKQEDAIYTDISKSRKSYKGRILKKKMSKGWGACYLFDLTDNQKIAIHGGNYNYLYTPSNLYIFLQVGDSIYKSKNTDSIYVFRKNLTYYFILGKELDK